MRVAEDPGWWGGLQCDPLYREKMPMGKITRSMRDFENFVLEAKLCDCPSSNASFTWTNGQTPSILSRLDKFLVSRDWEEMYPHYFQEVRTKITYDHWSVVLQANNRSYGPKLFRFENMWTTHSSFKDMVSKLWKECHVEGWEGFKFMQKLGYVKGKLREWNRNMFGSLKANMDNLDEELDEINRMVEE